MLNEEKLIEALRKIDNIIRELLDVIDPKPGVIKYKNLDDNKKGTRKLDVVITASTDKALMLMINGVENWFPKSTIVSKYEENYQGKQELVIYNWILKKHGVIE